MFNSEARACCLLKVGELRSPRRFKHKFWGLEGSGHVFCWGKGSKVSGGVKVQRSLVKVVKEGLP